ncbi:helix-turn-helix domain-containing protein [Acidianus infernus]|uniref:Helix-turn-helix domain-containing protein n=1 Tax=Acidianus infernus TaxID=12915 RepID=A0A6A9QGS4_ACIIN|nr:transcriptional regulator [Acidianus infernus]MUM65404.1 helix-turn-helix domain-containing protein [Acidianus infernus]
MKTLLLFSLLAFILIPSLTSLASTNVIYFKYPGNVVILDCSSKVVFIPKCAAHIVANVSYISNGSCKIILTRLPANISFIYHPQGVIKFSEPFDSKIIIELPCCTKIEYINTPPISFNISNGKIFITFYSDNITILYYINVQNRNNILYNPFLYLGIISTAGSIIITYKIMKGRSKIEVQTQEIDERDKKIIEAIKSGADNLTKIAELSSLPRTTVYRRVKKLVSLGIVNEIRENGKVRYEIKGDKNEKGK